MLKKEELVQKKKNLYHDKMHMTEF